MFEALWTLVKLIVVFSAMGFFLWVIVSFVSGEKPLLRHTVSHWQESIAGLSGTPGDFYAEVKALVAAQEMPGVVMKAVSWHEGGVFSDKRDYLRIRWGEFTFDLCVAPFGKSLFVSYWLSERPSTVLDFLEQAPFASWFVLPARRLLAPETYYKVDSAGMFQGAVHACILKVLDGMVAAQGLDPLPDSARKPVLRELYGKRPA